MGVPSVQLGQKLDPPPHTPHIPLYTHPLTAKLPELFGRHTLLLDACKDKSWGP